MPCKRGFENNIKLINQLDSLILKFDDEEVKNKLRERQLVALEDVLDYADLQNPGAFKVYMSGFRQTTTDIFVGFGWIALLFI